MKRMWPAMRTCLAVRSRAVLDAPSPAPSTLGLTRVRDSPSAPWPLTYAGAAPKGHRPHSSAGGAASRGRTRDSAIPAPTPRGSRRGRSWGWHTPGEAAAAAAGASAAAARTNRACLLHAGPVPASLPPSASPPPSLVHWMT